MWKKRILKIVILAVILLAFFRGGRLTLFRQGNSNETRIQGYYLEPKNTLDVVFIGASDMYNDFAPGLAYEKYGFTSYDYAIDAGDVSLWKESLQEILRTQNPSLIVIEVNGAAVDLPESSAEYEPALRGLTDNIPSGLQRNIEIREILDRTSYDQEKLSLYLPFLKYHLNLPESMKDFRARMGDLMVMRLRGYSLLKGAGVFTFHNEADPVRMMADENATAELPGRNERYLREFLDYCKDNHITNILFIRNPHLVGSEEDDGTWLRYRRSNTIGRIVQEYGYPFENFDCRYQEIGLDPYTDFADSDHLLITGQVKYTEWLGDYLSKYYRIDRHELSEICRKEWRSAAGFTDRYIQYAVKMADSGEGISETAELVRTLSKK